MAKFCVRSPVADYAGTVGGVQFSAGMALVDATTHPAELAYCQRSGYHVEEIPEEAEPGDRPPISSVTSEVTAVKPRRNGSAETWRAYAISQGMSAEEADTLSRDQLAERFAATDEETS